MELKQILDQLRSQQQSLEQAIRALEPLASGTRKAGKLLAMHSSPTGRHMSAASRKRLSESMRKRWAIRKGRRAA